ncbi:zeta-carotene-forming phytoene desaturase [compost metagenome]
MEFPVIFLGASPEKIPALYSLMNYGGYAMGTWYPMGGFFQLVLAMQRVAEGQGARFHFGHTVEEIVTYEGFTTGIVANGRKIDFDAVIASCDYYHSETLLPENLRNYQQKYWESRIFAPSCLIYYLGLNKKIPNLKHHTLFFENDLQNHINSIYETKKWPSAPLFYACCPSKTDRTVAPEGHENLFLLIPVAIGLEDTEAGRRSYLTDMLSRIERHTGIHDLADNIDYCKSYCIADFEKDYNAYGGNAYGLANTLGQTAVFKPSIKNRHLENLFYTGQLTVPGPGVPPAIISGRIVAAEINKCIIQQYNEKII